MVCWRTAGPIGICCGLPLRPRGIGKRQNASLRLPGSPSISVLRDPGSQSRSSRRIGAGPVRAREADEADADALASFVCSDGTDWQDEVEEYVRASLEWKRAGRRRMVKLFEDDFGQLVAVVAVE